MDPTSSGSGIAFTLTTKFLSLKYSTTGIVSLWNVWNLETRSEYYFYF